MTDKPQHLTVNFVWDGALLVRSDGLTIGSVWRGHRNQRWSGEAMSLTSSGELAVRYLSRRFDTEADARAAVENAVREALGGKPV